MKLIRIFGVLVALGLAMATVLPVQAASISVSPHELGPGGFVTISGIAPQPNQTINIASNAWPDRFIPATAGATGQFSTRFQVPNDLKPGTYSVAGREGGGVFATTTFVILPPPTGPTVPPGQQSGPTPATPTTPTPTPPAVPGLPATGAQP